MTLRRTLAAGRWPAATLVEQMADAGTEVFHRETAAGRWFELSIDEQLGNIGTEVARAARAKEFANESRPRFALRAGSGSHGNLLGMTMPTVVRA